jgi:pyrroloquinoline quinone biosynthesis protein B
MFVRVLGSGAGGGFPQWNCNCRNCGRLRKGELNGRARTQSSIAVSGDGVDWLLVNASPDIRCQLADFRAAQPGRSVRDTGIRSVLVVDAQIDHTSGLVQLRETPDPLPVYCTSAVHDDLTQGYPLLRLLEHFCGVDWREVLVAEGEAFSIPEIPGLRIAAVPLKSEAPPYSPHRHRTVPGDNIGLWIEDVSSRRSLFYAPGLGELDPRVLRCLEEADCVLVDGTVWTDDELHRAGIRDVRAREMGHVPLSGEGGLLRVLANLDRPRVILIHINNTNPILDEDSKEHAEVRRAGVELAYDGMELEI